MSDLYLLIYKRGVIIVIEGAVWGTPVLTKKKKT